jgi:two-component system, OmpR family, phosphate regulon sensor histidine kinase PhoR
VVTDESYDDLRAGFTAVVSHELRTPLARVMALLEGEAAPEDRLDRIRAEIEEMTELVDDVLFLAELETGRAVVALGPTKVLPELERVVSDYADRAERADLSIQVEGDPDAELPLRRRMLSVVAENLIENALRYAGPGSTLRLTIEPGALTATDDGPGVPEDDLPRLFERFYRGDRARTSRGTGLGLAIVKHIVTSAGGGVEARSGSEGGLEIRCSFALTPA